MLANDSGDSDWVDRVGPLPTHGDLSWDSSTSEWLYRPHHNGQFSDSFQYRLRDTRTGAVSNTATVSIIVRCNTAYQCYSG